MTHHPLKQFRLSKNISQEKLARTLGATVTTVARWERSESRVSRDFYNVVERHTGIKPAQLAVYEATRRPSTRGAASL